MRLRVKRSIILLILVVSLGMLVTGQVYVYTRDRSFYETHQETGQRLLDVIGSIRVTIDQYRYLPFLLTQNRDVKDLLIQPNPDKIIRVSRYLEQTNLIAGSAALIILDTQGDVVAYSNWRESKKAPRSYRSSEFFRQAISGEQGRAFATQSSSYYLSAPIYHRQTLIGVSVMKLDMEGLKEQLSLESAFFVTDEKGQTLFASRLLEAPSLLPLSSTPLKQEILHNGTLLKMKVDNEKVYLVHDVLLDDLRWRVGVVEPTKPLEQKAIVAALIVAGGFLALLLLGLYLREFRLKRRSQQEVLNAHMESEQRQRHIINTAQVGLVTVDTFGKILSVNQMVMQQFGVSLTLIEGQSLHILFADIELFVPLKRWLDGLQKGDFTPITGYEVVGQRSDGSTFPLLFSMRLMTVTPEPSYLVTIIDISRRKRLEYALREANESLEQKVEERTLALASAQHELIQAEKLAALGRMSAAMVHELNQPLTAMRNYLAIFRQVIDRPDLLKENLPLMNTLVDRMAGMTGQLKTFAYKTPDNMEMQRGSADLQGCVRNVLCHYEDRIRSERVGVSLECQRPTIFIKGDDVAVEQIINNLVSNALDAIAATGSSERQLSFHLYVQDQLGCLDISDNGAGVSKEQLKTLFEPFYTTKKIGTGLGLGLAIVQGIVRDLGGVITVKTNHPAEGLCFSVKLPLHGE